MGTEIATPVKVDQHFNNLYFTYYYEGKKYREIIKTFKAYFYTSDIKKPIINIQDCQKRYVDNCWSMKKEAETYSTSYQGDLNLSRLFLINTYKNIKSIPEVPLRVCFLDIENLFDGKISLEGKLPITAISVLDSTEDKIYTFSWHDDIQYKDKENCIAVFKTELEMLETFIQFMKIKDYDIILGWNIQYDIGYLGNRLDKFNLLDKLSPFGKVERDFRDANKFNIFGINTLDYLDMYRKYELKEMPSYSLDNVAKKEKLEGKVKYEGDLNKLWKNDLGTFLSYNRQDVRILKKLDIKKQYLALIDEIRRLGCVNFEDALMNSIVIDNILIRLLNAKNTVVISKKYISGTNEGGIQGAYVKAPIVGIHDWVIDNDFTSEYPYCIMNLNISPETKFGMVTNWRLIVPEDNGFLLSEVDNSVYFKVSYGTNYKEMSKLDFIKFIKEHNLSVAGNGALFDKSTKGIFPIILEWLFKQRKEYNNMKKQAIKDGDTKNVVIYHAKQMTMKILLNSFYGFMAFRSSRFYDPDLGEAVTLSGQKIIKFAIKEAEKLNCNVITTDTDSILFNNREIESVEQAIHLGKLVSKTINEGLHDFGMNEFNIENSTFDIKQEIVARRGAFFAKKRYVLWKINQEGNDIPEDEQMEYKGIDIVRNSTPPFVREHLVKVFECALKENDKEKVFELIDKAKREVLTTDINEVGIRTSLQKQISEYKKNMPIHVRGAKLWEEFYANSTQKTFTNETKGRYYFLNEFPGLVLSEKEMKALKKKGIVLTVPDGVKFPLDSKYIDYDRMIARLITKPVQHLVDIYEGKEIEETEEENEENAD